MSSYRAEYGYPPAYTERSGHYAHTDYLAQHGYRPQTRYPPRTSYSPQARIHGQNRSTMIVRQPRHTGAAYEGPRNYMVGSILACLLCFWPTGLVAIYYASEANNAADSGYMEEAIRLSEIARNFIIVSIVIGVLWIILAIVLPLVLFAGFNNYVY